MTRKTKVTAILATVLVVCGASAMPHAAPPVVPRPSVPGNLEVAAEFQPYLMVQADGTQNYGCLPLGAGVAWTLLGPQATLFDVNLNQVMTHYLSPNPLEGGIPRATWRHSHDSSAVWAVAVETSSDAAYVAPGAIPWLKLEVKGRQVPVPTAGASSPARSSSSV